MSFTDAQTKLLSSKLSEKHVKTRDQRGMKLSYVEGWHAIAEANRIFGFEGWDRETVAAECIWQDARREVKACAYAIRVRIRVRAGETVVSREGSGVGHGSGATLGDAHESALKEAETDATKRALATFGNLFGLALYDKQQLGVRRRAKRNGTEHPSGISWVLLAATGETLSQHDMPEGYCTAMRECLSAARDVAGLEAFWARNAATMASLRAVRPELRGGLPHDTVGCRACFSFSPEPFCLGFSVDALFRPPFLFGPDIVQRTMVQKAKRHRPLVADLAPHRSRLREARSAYRELGLTRTATLERDGTSYLFPWAGTVAVSTLALALKDAGLPAFVHRAIIELERTSLDKVRAVLRRLADSPAPDLAHLAHRVANLEREKYDRFLPRALLAIGFAQDRLAPDAVRAISQKLLPT
jgi:DNA recombination protein Rad52